MAIRNILVDDAPELRKTSRKVELFDRRLKTLVEDMFDTLKEADGLGLAAPQVGVLKRIFVITRGDGFMEFINPEIENPTGTQSFIEGCLSIPGVHGLTERPAALRVRAYDRDGNMFIYEAQGTPAVVVSHENDHLNGILFTDHAKILTDEELKELYKKDAEEQGETEEDTQL